MRVKLLVTILCMVLLSGVTVLGVAKTPQQIMKEESEMRKNIAWTLVGLDSLCKSTDRKLALSKSQAQKILPIYLELIDKKLIRIEAGDDRQAEHPGEDRNKNGDQNKQDGPKDHKDQKDRNEVDPKRLQRATEQVGIWNLKMKQIDGILSKQQVSFIDNMKFDPTKYGIIDKNVNRNQADQDNKPQRDPKQKEAQRKLTKEGKARLVKLSKGLLEMLKIKAK